jgi:NUMOD3 motif
MSSGIYKITHINSQKFYVGSALSVEQKQKISDSLRGRARSESVKQKIALAHTGKSSSMKGKKHTVATREKMSVAKKLMWKTWRDK